MELVRILKEQRSSCRSSSKIRRLVGEKAVSCRVLGAAFVPGRSKQRGRPGVPLYSATKGQRHWRTRTIRSIVKQTDVRAADLTRPTADGARGRRPKITGDAELGLAGAELSRLEHHSHRARPASTVSSSRFGEGAGGLPIRIRRVPPATIAHTCAELTMPRSTMTLWVKSAVAH
jgi:hypothetical protein